MISTVDPQLGDHVCLPFDTDDALQAHVGEFTAAGLTAGDRVMVFTQSVSVDAMTGWLRYHRPGFASALDGGQLQVHSPGAVHLAGGHFDAERMMAGFAHTTDQAEADGYPGLRVTVDMSWALQRVPGVEQLFDFEAVANRLFIDRRLAAVCAYDRRRFSRAAIQRACAAHPITPGMSMLRFARPARPGLRLSGEVDMTNRHALRGLLAALPDDDLTLDLTGITFIDGRGAGLIAHHAATSAGHTTLRCTPATARLLRLLDIDQVATIAAG